MKVNRILVLVALAAGYDPGEAKRVFSSPGIYAWGRQCQHDWQASLKRL